MNRTEVTSSNIKSIGYDEETKTLEVEFHKGDVWQYRDVPKSVYEALRDAPSVGAYFAQNIRSKFAAVKL